MQAFDQLLQPPPPHRLLLVPSSAAASQDVKFTILFHQLHLNRIANLCPGPRQEVLLQLAEPRAGCADQVVGWCLRSRISGSTASVGMPRSITQVRPALPYWTSIRLRKSPSVVLSEVLPGITS